MIPPILRLHADVWSTILPHLSAESILNLCICGGPHLSRALHERAQSLKIEGRGRFVDLRAWLQHVSKFPRATELSLAPPGRLYTALWPLNSDLIPNTLTSLILRFSHCAWAFTSYVDLSIATPSLKILHLKDQTSRSLYLNRVNLPTGLTSLSLNMLIFLAQGDVLRLPRSLTKLKLTSCREVGGLSVPLCFTQAEWPLGLTDLSMTATGLAGIPLYALPRSLTSLTIAHSCILWNSGNSYTVGIIDFPFRSFFPHLEHLRLHENFSVELSLLLVPTLLETEKYARYNLNLLPSSAPPCWKTLKVRMTIDNKEAAEPHLQQLAPVKTLEAFSTNIVRLMPFFPSLTIFNSPFIHLTAENLVLPPLITKMDVGGIPIGRIPPTTTWLRARISLALATSKTEFPAQSLTYLKTNGPFTNELALVLPQSIEELEISFSNTLSRRPGFPVKLHADLTPLLSEGDEHLNSPDWSRWMTWTDATWKTMAERLTRLRALTIDRGDGFPTMALTPIKSTQFESISLINDSSPIVRAWLACLLDGMNTAGRPPVLPSTTRSVSIQSTETVPICVLAMLPRSTTVFRTTTMSKDVLPNFPLDPELSPTDIMLAMPPGLETFDWSPIPIGGHIFKISSESILSWPKTLHILRLPAQFQPTVTGDTKELRSQALVPLLPPRLAEVSWAADLKLMAVYMKLQGRKVLSEDVGDVYWLSPSQTPSAQNEFFSLYAEQ